MVAQIQEIIASSNAKAAEAEEQSRKAQTALADAEKARQEAEEATRKGRLDAAAQLETIVSQATRSAQTLEEQIHNAAAGSDAQAAETEKAISVVAHMHDTVTTVARDAALTEEKATATREKAAEGGAIVTDVVASINTVSQGTQIPYHLADDPRRQSRRHWAAYEHYYRHCGPDQPACIERRD